MNKLDALQLWRMAADAGYANSQFSLGRLYFDGECGLVVNKPEAVRWWRLAAAQGFAEAQRMIKLHT